MLKTGAGRRQTETPRTAARHSQNLTPVTDLEEFWPLSKRPKSPTNSEAATRRALVLAAARSAKCGARTPPLSGGATMIPAAPRMASTATSRSDTRRRRRRRRRAHGTLCGGGGARTSRRWCSRGPWNKSSTRKCSATR
jgi:hypothetical protein